jgi:PPOX class probable F420-dependent enzyme
MGNLEQFKKQKYLNLETFRKSGESMKTPVWFVQDGETIYVTTMANSGKVKRARNHPNVNIAACRVDGKVTGTWVPANVHEITDPDINKKVDQLLGKKYGLMKKLFDNQRAKNETQNTVLEIKLIS